MKILKSVKKTLIANDLLFVINQKNEESKKFLKTNLNHGYIYNQDKTYKIIKFWAFAANKGYLTLFISFILKTKKTQKIKIKIRCQNLAIKHNAT